MGWDEIKGQDEAVGYLRRALEKGSLIHALLFHGPEGVGKALTAGVLARTLNCERGGSEPCDDCRSCLMIREMNHPDVFFIGPRSKSRQITIDLLREMQKLAHLNARLGPWKVFIVEDADAMNESASNSLLKTLEEPPSETVIILVTARPEQLSSTIRSRCQPLRFRPWPLDLMRTFLTEEGELSGEEAEVLHAISGGRPGRALKMHKEGFFQTRRSIFETLEKGEFASGKELVREARSWEKRIRERSRSLEAELTKKRTAWGKDLEPHQLKNWEEQDRALAQAESRSDLSLFFEIIYSWFHDLYLIRNTGGEREVINLDFTRVLREQAKRWSGPDLLRALEGIEWSRNAVVNRNVSAVNQIFENLFLELGFWQST
jgi:DNA polymerase-3 subunit delta'